MPSDPLGDRLEALHRQWHHPDFLGTDPLGLVLTAAPENREATAFLISCLAIGRASLIVRAGTDLLDRLGPGWVDRLRQPGPSDGGPALDGFVYRFFSAAKVRALLEALGRVIRTHGTLEEAWRSTGVRGWDALEAFAGLFRTPDADLGVLLPTAGSAGAHKRLNLFLRWMVRRDGIDPGGWSALSPAQLFMPVDTHVLQWARAEGLTARTASDRKSCAEITAALRALSPEDPLRYDFAITREGMARKGTLF